MTRRARFLLMLPVLAACAADAAAPRHTARDSAGIRIVEYADAPVAARAITVAPEPLWRHGDEPGEHEFTFIGSGALQPDGGAVIADARANEVLLLGPDGTLRTVLARSGSGPAEVAGVTSVHVLGQDTILVEDDRNQKLMIFAGGALARSIRVAGDRSATRGLRGLGMASADALLMVTSSFQPDAPEPWIRGVLVRFDLGAAAADTVGSFDIARSVRREGPRNPFSPHGSVAASGGRFVVSRSDVPELTWRGADGQVIQILRWAPNRVHPTDEHLALFVEDMRADLARVNPNLARAELERFTDEQVARLELEPGQPIPLWGFLEGDGRGGLWMSEYALSGRISGIRGWTAVGADGEWLGPVLLPERFRVLDIRDDRVLGVLLDDRDVQSVAVFELQEAPLAR